MIKGQDFNVICTVTLTVHLKVAVSFMWRSSGEILNNSSDVTVTSIQDGLLVVGRLTVHNAVFSDTEELICMASGYVQRRLVSVNQSSTIHSSVGKHMPYKTIIKLLI